LDQASFKEQLDKINRHNQQNKSSPAEMFVLHGRDFYRTADGIRASLIFLQGTRLNSAYYPDYPREELLESSKTLIDDGYRPARLGGHLGWDGTLRFSGYWVKDGLLYENFIDLSAQEFQQQLENLREGFRPVWIDAYRDGGKRRYALIAVQGNDGPPPKISTGLTLDEFQRALALHIRQGFYPHVVNVE
jgi:hypothetical protein